MSYFTELILKLHFPFVICQILAKIFYTGKEGTFGTFGTWETLQGTRGISSKKPKSTEIVFRHIICLSAEAANH